MARNVPEEWTIYTDVARTTARNNPNQAVISAKLGYMPWLCDCTNDPLIMTLRSWLLADVGVGWYYLAARAACTRCQTCKPTTGSAKQPSGNAGGKNTDKPQPQPSDPKQKPSDPKQRPPVTTACGTLPPKGSIK